MRAPHGRQVVTRAWADVGAGVASADVAAGACPDPPDASHADRLSRFVGTGRHSGERWLLTSPAIGVHPGLTLAPRMLPGPAIGCLVRGRLEGSGS